MNLLVIDNHDGEGVFPTFSKGTAVENIAPTDQDSHWFSCTINGMETYIPELYIGDSALNREYNPTELIAKKSEVVEFLEIAYEWLYVKNQNGEYGWIPASKVVSI